MANFSNGGYPNRGWLAIVERVILSIVVVCSIIAGLLLIVLVIAVALVAND